MFFLAPGRAARGTRPRRCWRSSAARKGVAFLGWREVPADPEVLGKKALDCMPCICQCVLWPGQWTVTGVWTLTGSSMSSAGNSSRSNDEHLCVLLVQPHHRLQGYVPGEAAAAVLSRTCRMPGLRERHRHGALPVLHQHQPQLGAGPSQPLHPPQRRDQHHPGQRRPDAGPGGDHGVSACSRRTTWTRSCRW